MRRNELKYIFLVLLFCAVIPVGVVGQLQQVGGIGSFSLSKEFGPNLELGAEQEFRFDRNFTSLSRSSTSIGADYVIVRKILRAQLNYDLHYRRNNDERYEFRHRVSAGFLTQQKVGRFNFRWRTRMQMTYRNENTGDYSYNPKYVWRNRLEVNYDIRKSPFRPYVSAEAFCPLNSDYGFFMDSYRLIAGMKYDVNRQNSLNVSLRFDQDIQQAKPENILWLNVGWSYSLK